MKYEDFGVNLARVRISKSISAYELSLRMGRSTTYISKVESGKINISLRALLEICEQLEINPKDLF